MKTLKKHLKQENIDSTNIKTILTDYSKRDCVKVALYCAEDCFHLNPTKESQTCIDLVKKWLEDETSVTVEELRTAAYWVANADIAAASYSAASYSAAVYSASNAFGKDRESKLEEYRSYARLFAYEDLNFPYRKEAKTFNLDNETDLNIFLDFLTAHYPEAITYDREEYFTNKLAKEYLRVIYQ